MVCISDVSHRSLGGHHSCTLCAHTLVTQPMQFPPAAPIPLHPDSMAPSNKHLTASRHLPLKAGPSSHLCPPAPLLTCGMCADACAGTCVWAHVCVGVAQRDGKSFQTFMGRLTASPGETLLLIKDKGGNIMVRGVVAQAVKQADSQADRLHTVRPVSPSTPSAAPPALLSSGSCPAC